MFILVFDFCSVFIFLVHDAFTNSCKKVSNLSSNYIIVTLLYEWKQCDISENDF